MALHLPCPIILFTLYTSSVQLLMVQGYQLGPSQLDFAITATVTSTKADGSALVETLTLDPSTPYVLDDANLVSVQLLGDLLTYTALPVFTDMYLMVPSPTGASRLTMTSCRCSH